MPIILSIPPSSGDMVLELDAAGSAIGGGNPGTSMLLTDTAGGYTLTRFEAPEPDQEVQWASSADTEGAVVASQKPLNRTVTIQVEILKSTVAATEAEFNKLGRKIHKFRKNGGTLKFTTPGGTVGYFDILAAGHGFPWDHRLIVGKLGDATLTLQCSPYIRGDEVDLGDNVETTLPALVFTEATIAGDVEALGRLVVDDDSGSDQWWLTWGIQSRNYSNSANAALFYEAEGRTPLGGASVVTGPSGASGGASNNVVRQGTLTFGYQAMFSTQATGGGAHLSHVGTFQVFARVQMPTTNTGAVSLALEWAEGEFRRHTTNAAVTFTANHSREGQWVIVDLGLVTLRPVVQGAQRWEGRILAKSSVSGDDLDIDYIFLVPVDEGSGIARTVQQFPTPTSFLAIDDFDQAPGALSGKTLPTGGTWSGAGDADDYAVAATIGSGSGQAIKRNPAAGDADSLTGRYAIAGSTNYTDTVVSAKVRTSSLSLVGGGPYNLTWVNGVLARYTDTNNWLMASTRGDYDTFSSVLEVRKRVAGTVTTLGSYTVPWSQAGSDLWELIVLSSGVWMLTHTPSWTRFEKVLRLSGYDSSLATGGTLATGKPGVYGYQSLRGITGGVTSTWQELDEFMVWAPSPDVVIAANQSLELRHDRIHREDSTGSVWSSIADYAGKYLLVPSSGQEARTVRMIVKASRTDPDVGPDSGVDDISARLFVTPRFLAMPD